MVVCGFLVVLGRFGNLRSFAAVFVRFWLFAVVLVVFGDDLTTFLLAVNVFDLRGDMDFFEPDRFAETGGVDFTIFGIYDQEPAVNGGKGGGE